MISLISDEMLPSTVISYRTEVEDAIVGEGITDETKAKIQAKFLDLRDFALGQPNTTVFISMMIVVLRTMAAERLTTLSGSKDVLFHLCNIDYAIIQESEKLPLEWLLMELAEVIRQRCLSRNPSLPKINEYAIEVSRNCADDPIHALEHVACLNWIIALVHSGRLQIST